MIFVSTSYWLSPRKIRFYDVIAGITSAVAAIHPEGLSAQSDQKEYGKHIIKLHQTICDAVCARDVETATQAMKSHFDSPVSALINHAMAHS